MNSHQYLFTIEVTVFFFFVLFGNPNISAGESSINSVQPKEATPALLQELKTYPHKLVYETHRNGNWDFYLVNADGSNPVNLTRTPDVDELYPKVSPDGTRICFMVDEIRAEIKSRNIYLMNIDGSERRKIADNARDPAWRADGKSIAYLPGEFKMFTLTDYATKGIVIFDLKTGQTREHPNSEINHLYCLNWSPDGNWFVATVHGGMGFKHGIVALEANGTNVFHLGLDGCRPDLNPDGKKVAWGHGNYATGVADLDFSTPIPKALGIYNLVQNKDPMRAIYADWSPDGRYIAFTYGDKLEGQMKNAPGLTGAEAPGWNICVADTMHSNRWVVITADGTSCKEPDWVYIRQTRSK